MFYVFGMCERCKEPIELRLNMFIDKNADVTTRLALYHKPTVINGTRCGGRVHVLAMHECRDASSSRMLTAPELWLLLHESGVSIRKLIPLAKRSYEAVRRMLLDAKNVDIAGVRAYHKRKEGAK